MLVYSNIRGHSGTGCIFMAAKDKFNLAGKTPKELGEMLLEELDKAEWANEEKVNALLDAKASIEERNAKGYTPLLLTAVHGLPKIANRLLDMNANYNAVTNRNESALMLSLQPVPPGLERADDEFRDVATAVLKKKPDVTIVSDLKETALTIVAGQGLYFFARDILALNPDLDLAHKDWTNEDALTRSKRSPNHSKTTELLEGALQAQAERRLQAQKQLELEQFDANVATVTKMVGQGTTRSLVAPETASFKPRPKTPI